MSGLTEEQRVLYNQLQNVIGYFVEGFNDKIKEKHEIETKQVTNKAMNWYHLWYYSYIGSQCWCGVAGASILFIAGIACCAGSWTCCWWYICSIKPSNKLDEPDSNKVASAAQKV